MDKNEILKRINIIMYWGNKTPSRENGKLVMTCYYQNDVVVFYLARKTVKLNDLAEVKIS